MAKEHVEVFASAARTATPTDANVTIGSKGGFFVINVSAVTATPSVTFAVNGVDPASNAEFNIITSAAITATGTTVLRVYPGLTVSANVTVSDILPAGINVSATHGDADSITYSVQFIGVD